MSSRIKSQGTPKSKQSPLAAPESKEIQNFKLPESISFSDFSFPVLEPLQWNSNWNDIETEHAQWVTELEQYNERKAGVVKLSDRFLSLETDYIQKEVFGALLPALGSVLDKAKLVNALEDPKCLFNGVDYLAQILWNNNEKYPNRKEEGLTIFEMPWVKEHLKKFPRPFYPKSWLWTQDYGATVIQRSFRRYLTLKDPEVFEMRDFWRKLEREDLVTQKAGINPLLLKKYASALGVRFAADKVDEEDKKEKEKMLIW